ncbi:MAG: nitroreductase family protein [Desulfobacterales bacterium]|jgi:nitroreductase
MDSLKAIRTRRSIRKFKDKAVTDEIINKIIAAGTWAPFGRNQLWRFAIIRNKDIKSKIAKLTVYSKIIKNAPVIIAVFFDHRLAYHEIKDAQTMGACIQNMLLAIHGLGLAAVWIGEILKNSKTVQKLCKAPETYDLSAVIALGYGNEDGKVIKRDGLDKVVFLRE